MWKNESYSFYGIDGEEKCDTVDYQRTKLKLRKTPTPVAWYQGEKAKNALNIRDAHNT